MAYFAPFIDAAGLHIPTYLDILTYLISQYQGIYGPNVNLDIDSADYQDISVRGLQVSDTDNAVQVVYTNMNPRTAIGPSLDLLGVLIGTARKVPSFSTVTLTITGTAGTVITNGQAQDTIGNFWILPGSVTIPNTGTVDVTATAQNLGAVTANPNTITAIATPTAGWISVNNAAGAAPGQPVESDSAYRARLLIAQAKPSLTRLAGTAAAVAAVPGVTRSQVYENQKGLTQGYGTVTTVGTAVTLKTGQTFAADQVGLTITINAVAYTISAVGGPTAVTLSSSAGTQSTPVSYVIGDGINIGPSHSITTVVEGGASAAIAQAIYDNRGIGCDTNGSTTVVVTDPSNGGLSMSISFDILAYLQIYVKITVHPLTGYTTATGAAIMAGIVGYLNSLGIGQAVVASELYGAALTARQDRDQPTFSIRAIIDGSLAATTNAAITTGSADITVTSATGLVIGQAVQIAPPASGNFFVDGTTISNISGTTVTLSANPLANGTFPVNFFTLVSANTDIPIAFNVAAQGNNYNVQLFTV